MSIALALDLEGTLIASLSGSNLERMDPGPVHARPGLWDFLEWAKARFRLVIFTGVPPVMASRAMSRVVEAGAAPAWFAELPIFEADPPYGEWRMKMSRRPKDLSRIGPLGTVIMLDDSFMTHFVGGQGAYWLEITHCGAKTMGSDTALADIRPEIEALAAKLAKEHA